MLFDVHAHLEFKQMYEYSVDEIIRKSKEKGVRRIVNAGVDITSNNFSLELSKKYSDIVLCGLGLHPETIVNKPDEAERCYVQIKTNLNEVKAISEIGLDGTLPLLKEQQSYFIKLIKLGIKYKLPLIIHTRKAEKEVFEILIETRRREESKNLPPIVLHSFSGKKSLIRAGIEEGWYFSIPPNILRSQHFQMLVKLSPLRQLLTETDSPFLPPFPNQVNYPWNVAYSIKKIAEIKCRDESEVEKQLEENFNRIFPEP